MHESGTLKCVMSTSVMSTSVFDRYLEGEILSADRTTLVVILYRAAIEAIAAARVNVRRKEIRERSQRITKASSIIHELLRSLNRAEGGEISHNLAELYAYVETRLIQANVTQTEAPLAEAESLLQILLDAWIEAARANTQAANAGSEPPPVDQPQVSASW